MLADFLGEAFKVLKTYYPNDGSLSLLREDGGIFDVILPDRDITNRAAIHIRLRQIYKDTAEKHGFSGQVASGLTGLAIFETGICARDPAATVERVHQLKDAYKRSGITDVTPTENGTYKVRGADGKSFEMGFSELARQPHAILPTLHRTLLTQEMISRDHMIGLLALPSGMVSSQWFGVDIAQAVSANTTIQKLLRAGKITEEQAVGFTESREAFLQHLEKGGHEYRDISITDAPMLTNGVKDGRLTTLALAKRWGLMAPAVSPMILRAQLSARAVLAVKEKVPNKEAALEKLAKNIKLSIHEQDSEDVKFASALDQAAKILTYARVVDEALPDAGSQIQSAAFTMLRRTALAAQEAGVGPDFSAAMLAFTRHTREADLVKDGATIINALQAAQKSICAMDAALGQKLESALLGCCRIIGAYTEKAAPRVGTAPSVKNSAAL
ncbi:MAG: hypothetical protein EBQ96_05605 [Proteobacteria bacterium]|nr:hypothetical protein [Pseudomonadota bacterium]